MGRLKPANSFGFALALYLGRNSGTLELKDRAPGGIDYVSVSSAVNQFENRLGNDVPRPQPGSKAT